MSEPLEFQLSDLGKWTPGVTALRETIMAGRVFQPSSAVRSVHHATERELNHIVGMAMEAVTAGRVIDLGQLPNAVIGECGRRGGYLWDQDALRQPFEEPWIFCHSWTMETGRMAEPAVAIYVVNPVPTGCEIVELQPCRLRGIPVLLAHDRALLEKAGENSDPRRYKCQVAPSSLRYLVPEDDSYNEGRSPEAAAASNVLDPLMAALMLVNTDGVRRETVRPADKLNRARARSRKPPIPPHDRIDSKLYVTAIMARLDRPRREPGGGHHASPVPHVRRGHYRTYESGQRSFIRDTLVNVTDEARAAFVAKRSHYEVRP